jgi:subtilisin-like proprotein convertase family protein
VIKLRFRFASDCSVGAPGHNIDTISVTDGFSCCGVSGAPTIIAGTQTLVQESCLPTNSAVDPNERVSMNLQLKNTGTAATTNLVATLQSSPNVIAPSGPTSFGSIPIGGTAARDISFTAVATCGDNISLVLNLQDGAMNLGTVTFTVPTGALTPGSPVTFSNPTSISIPSSGVASPYPSNILVSGLGPSANKVTVTITNLSHTFPDDVDFLLVSPSGRKMIIMSDAGGGNAVTNVSITLDDAAATVIPDSAALASGTFRPGNYGTVQDAFAAPAPAGPYLTPQTGGVETLTTAFTGGAGGNPNGTWSLYVVDDAGGDLGSISGGWSLTITPLVPVCTTPCGGPNVVVFSTLSRSNSSTVIASITVQNIGAFQANNVMLTTAKLGATNGTPLPQSLGSLAPGASVNTVVSFTNSTPGANANLVVGGTYTGGSFSTTKRVTIP